MKIKVKKLPEYIEAEIPEEEIRKIFKLEILHTIGLNENHYPIRIEKNYLQYEQEILSHKREWFWVNIRKATPLDKAVVKVLNEWWKLKISE